jgi:hypothetical protein
MRASGSFEPLAESSTVDRSVQTAGADDDERLF